MASGGILYSGGTSLSSLVVVLPSEVSSGEKGYGSGSISYFLGFQLPGSRMMQPALPVLDS